MDGICMNAILIEGFFHVMYIEAISRVQKWRKSTCEHVDRIF